MPEQKQVKLKINDREVAVAPGTLVIEAARRMGIEVPSFCYYPGLSLQAACRMCLVEVEKAPKLQTACTLVAMEGMVVRTETDQVKAARKSMLEFLLTNHPLDCPVCDKGGECELQDMVFRYGADTSRFFEEKRHRPEEKWSEAVYYDAPRCILCFRCVRVCDEGMDVKALGVGQRGSQSVIIPNREDHLECEECGMCIDICPVGALTSGTYRYKTRPWEMKYVSTVCTHCSNGCKTTLSVRNNQILRANNRDLSGINKEFLCVKGRFGFDFTEHPDRLREPLVRKNGKLEAASWEEAFELAARRLKQIRDKHGADAMGFIGSNRTSNEENYVLQRLARATFGTNNVDHHRTADYAGLIAALGDQAPRAAATMSHLGEAKAILLVGNDPTEQNPLVGWQIRSAIRQHGARLYAINARDIKLRRKTKLFVQVKPGTEAAAIHWLARSEGNVDGNLAADLGALKEALAGEADVAIVFGSEIFGEAARDLVQFGSTLPGQTRYMALGDYSNSRGAADMGELPDRLPGYAALDDDAARTAFGKLWGAKIPQKPGLSAQQMLEAARSGKLAALYVVGANPVKTFASGKDKGRGKLELLIVQEMFLTETAALADIVFPAECAYEKDGTVTNTAGEVQLLHKGGDVMGPRSDFEILRILSYQLERAGLGKGSSLKTPDAVFEEIRKNVRGYNVAITGLLTGGAEMAAPVFSANGHAPRDAAEGQIFSSRDTLFTSGTLGRYCKLIDSLPEAEAKL
ncbi:MAG TPA: NADH-quinone oxidoreductase subunit NuoG [Candidatus Acidoferrales bacterium]|nr:NADH-quinone oxidoreductase subunit NuoG [Candidatus Acidoferrales bacterium]